MKTDEIKWYYRHYLWQLEAYGKGEYVDHLPVDVYTKANPTPSTPSGTYVCTCPTPQAGLAKIKELWEAG